MSLSFPLSLLFTLVVSCHLNVNLLRPETLFVLGHPLLVILLPHMFGSVMIKLDRTFQRTFLDEAFIRKAKSFCWTSLTLTFPLSTIVGVQEFYSNKHGFDYSVPLFVTHVRGMRIMVTPNIVSKRAPCLLGSAS